MFKPVFVLIGVIAAACCSVIAVGWFYTNVINVDVDGKPLAEWHADYIPGTNDPRLRNRYGTSIYTPGQDEGIAVAVP